MTITVTATAELSNTPPRVRLNIAASAGETSATITRLNPDGTTVPVRTLDGLPQVITSGAAIAYDYEMPYQAEVTYSSVETPASTSTVTVAESRVWLVHPGVPGLSMPVTVGAFGARSRKVSRGVFYPMGRATPITVTDGARKAAEYDLTLVTLTDADRLALDDLLGDAGTLLLNVPAVNPWGQPAEYISVGDVSEERVVRIAAEPARRWSLPCVVVDRPVGGSQAQRTLLDLLVYPTLNDIGRAYPTLTAVMIGP